MAQSFDDRRPEVWVGHIALTVPDVAAAREFFRHLGMRDLMGEGSTAIMELRGGTHLVLMPEGRRVSNTDAPFDLMVDDIDAYHLQLGHAGLSPSGIFQGPYHRRFTVEAPSGHRMTIVSTHASGKPV